MRDMSQRRILSAACCRGRWRVCAAVQTAFRCKQSLQKMMLANFRIILQIICEDDFKSIDEPASALGNLGLNL